MSLLNPLNAEGKTETADTAPDQLISLAQQALIAQATELARSGRYAEAEAVLDRIKDGPSAQVLDLRAKIKAQQGLFSEAASLWGLAIKTAPENKHYASSLKQASRRAKHPAWLAHHWSGLAALTLLALALLLIMLPGKKVMQGSDVMQNPITAPQSRVMKNGDDSTGQSSGKMADRKEQTGIAVEKISLKGVRIFKTEEKMTILFEEGLFTEGTQFHQSARPLLAQLGRQIAGIAPDVQIQVVGCTDDLPLVAGSLYADNSSLGLARAVKVIEILRKVTGLPASAFMAQSMAENNYPYAINSSASKMRNRTAVIRLLDQTPANSLIMVEDD